MLKESDNFWLEHALFAQLMALKFEAGRNIRKIGCGSVEAKRSSNAKSNANNLIIHFEKKN
jgi:hypothetical protein